MESPSLSCGTCNAKFTFKSSLMRHERTHHGQRVLYVCDDCGNTFGRLDSLKRHQRNHQPCTKPPNNEELRFECTTCKAQFLNEKDLKEHKRTHQLAEETYLCHTCGRMFKRRNRFLKHINLHRPSSTRLHGKGTNRHSSQALAQKTLQLSHINLAPSELPSHIDPTSCVGKIYQEHWLDIKDRRTTGRVYGWYNFHLPTVDNAILADRAQDVFDQQTTSFKINVSYGFVLRHNETEECRYYYASQNTKILDSPMLITNQASFQEFIRTVQHEDVLEYARSLRPNSKWVVEHVTNVKFYVFRLVDHTIGHGIELPSYIQDNRSIIALVKNRSHGHQYTDRLCLFRCLALSRGCDSKGIESMAKSLFKQYEDKIPASEFEGVKLNELHRVEETFKINITVYELVKVESDDIGDSNEERETESLRLSEEKVTARLVRRGLEKFSDTMYVNLYEDHFSYVTNIDLYCQSYQCRKCQKLWKTRKALQRHERLCTENGTAHVFPKGMITFHNHQTIWEELADQGISVDEDRKFFPYFATFDIESYMEQSTSLDNNSAKLNYVEKHIPMSVSMNSNVPGYDNAFCLVSDGDPYKLIRDMVDYLLELSQRSFSLLESTYVDVLEMLHEKEQEVAQWMKQTREQGMTSPKKNHVTLLKEKLLSHLKELPVIGFNSGKYDINVLKEFLYPTLLEKDPFGYIIKRNNNHMAIKTQHLRFLDILNYLAPGFSLASFLKAYGCKESKGHFPHGWVDSLEKLELAHLPPIESFNNALKQTSLTLEEYEDCQRIWRDQGMTCMRDYLMWYNNLDVTPLIEAIEKMRSFYIERNIDLFKDGISVPGLTMKYLMQCSPNAHFSLISEKDKDLFYTFRDNLVGGPSIIFHRYHEKNKTKIRGGKTCQKIVGFDANALYLYAIMQHMPTDHYIRRRRENNFKPENRRPIAQEWLEFESFSRQIPIRHAGNNTEKRIGPLQLPVDGFCAETRQVFEFNGCWYHGHSCHLSNGQTENKKLGKSMADLLKKTKEKQLYIESLGYEYISVWECDYLHRRKHDEILNTFLSQRFPPTKFQHGLTQHRLLSAISNNELFGFVECDIHVPDHLKERFSEMCPIFKNVDIVQEDIGDVMGTYAKKHGIMKTPRRSLIGSMFGEKILLYTPLLQWYLEHGLVVTNINQFIEYRPNACFRMFGEAVSDARRAGDSDPCKRIIADTMKLIGNSSYGKTITNKAKHLNVNVCNEKRAQKNVNNILFRDLNPIAEDCYEVDMAKRKIKMDLPVQIGHAVYQMAKLRMLQFYYDFLLKYVDPSDFQMCEMDTDSAYIAISSDDLEDVIMPHMREEYKNEKCNWFPRDDTQEHARYDKRTPGLFKVEWEGDGIVALCSKTYYCFGATDKFSCKGISKRQNDITKDTYLNVLHSQKAAGGKNRGFRIINNGVSTYTQVRNAFTYFYSKRKVLEDNVSTTYLDI